MIRARQPTIDRALEPVEQEITLVRDERDAFVAFLDRLHDIQARRHDTPQTTGGATTVAMSSNSPVTELREVQQAYRETVMGVPHYEREYGDTLQESLKEELGETLASHVIAGRVLTLTIRGAIIEATEQSRENRERFLRSLRQERESLCSIAEELNDIELRLVDIAGCIDDAEKSADFTHIDETLQTLEERCTDLATQRQERIRARPSRPLAGVDTVSLSQYLYREMETVTPALTDIISCLETVRNQRRRCLR